MTDPGFVFDVTLDYVAVYVLFRGLVATVFDVRKGGRWLLRKARRWVAA